MVVVPATRCRIGQFTLKPLAEWLGRRLGKFRAITIVDDEGVMIDAIPDRDVVNLQRRS
jgi:hypothetical protein